MSRSACLALALPQQHGELAARLCAALIVALLLAATALAAAPSPYEIILREKNVEPTSESLAQYLTDLHPSDDQVERGRKLIEQLGDPESFHAREDAMAKLLIMPTLPTEALVTASQGDDPEVRWRAKRVLDIGKPESSKVMHAAFKVIETNKTTGVIKELLAAMPLCDKKHLQLAARDALIAASRPVDADLLRGGLKQTNGEIRAAAAAALGECLGAEAQADLTPLLTDADDNVKFAAARAFANLGDRRSLVSLAELMESKDLTTRVSASMALRQLTGQNIMFAAYDTEPNRAAALAKWKTWIEKDGQTAKLNFPLKKYGGGTGYLAGNTLLAYGYRNKVAELDPSGKEIWTYPGMGAWSAEKMANGNVLIAEYNSNRVIEVDMKGKVVWEFSVPNPLNAKPLENGNYLIAQHSGNRAIEVSPDKRIVWEFGTQSSCSDIHRLENGNTLIACYGSAVVEITPDKKTVWEYPTTQCYGCQPLPNGNVLIANFDGKVVEVTRDKKEVWEFREQNAVDAFRLPNGNTLITSGNRFVEVSPDKKVVWEQQGCSYGSARR